jgi:hypothetical protein
MAGTLALAMREVEQHPEFDRRVRLVIDRPEPTPTPPTIARAFITYDYRAELTRVYEQIRAKWRQVPDPECDDAVSEALTLLLQRRPQLFEGPPTWMGLLMKTATDILNDWMVQKKRLRLQSIEQFFTGRLDKNGDRVMMGARLLGSGRPRIAEVEARDIPHAPGEPWTRVPMIGAAQRFYYGPAMRVPKVDDCKPARVADENDLPPFDKVVGEFGTFTAWLKAAGLEPTIEHRPRFTHEEAALACRAFHAREGRWPNSLYFRYSADFGLPPERVARKFFGGSTAKHVQRGVEEFLGER